MSDRRVRKLTSEQEEALIHTLPVWARKRLERREIMLTATQSNYVREHDQRERAEADAKACREALREAVAVIDHGGTLSDDARAALDKT